ncbi:MAG: c-type cytochrome domain-containing protein [Akkermansiaceae bacterium]
MDKSSSKQAQHKKGPDSSQTDKKEQNSASATAETSDSSLQKKFFIPVVILSGIAILIVAILPFLGEVGMASESATTTIGKWVGFLGEFHPLFLHLPIGAVMLVIVMEVLRLITMGKYSPPTTLGLSFASATGVFAMVFGYCLYLTGDFSGELIEEHKRDGIIFTILLIATFLVKYASDIGFIGKFANPSYILGLFLTTAMMMSAGHHGGEITHGDPLDKAPWKVDEEAATAEVITDPVVYTNIIHPILEQKCISCHGEKKQKSGLRMDSYAALLDGGEETDCLIPGDTEQSAMVSYLHLPMEDDLHMPPEGKKQLTQQEIEIIEWWVKIGAPEASKLSEVEVTESITAAIETLKTPEQIAREKAALEKAEKERAAAFKAKRARLAAALETINGKYAGSLSYISKDSTDLSFSAVSYRKDFNDESMAILKDAAADITELDLSASAITDDSAQSIGDFVNLRTLKLNQTSITDSTLPEIQRLNQLEVLNLHSTNVSDDGLANLEPMSSLKRVFLWNTKVTEAGAQALEQILVATHTKAQEGLEEEDQDKTVPAVILGASSKKAAAPEKQPAPEAKQPKAPAKPAAKPEQPKAQ